MARILVVEDDPDIRDLLSLSLTRSGHDVHVEDDGETGLQRACELLPDVVVVDWLSPRLSGPEVCRRLREDHRMSRTRVMLLTGRAHEDDVSRGLSAGADDVLHKSETLRAIGLRIDALADES